MKPDNKNNNNNSNYKKDDHNHDHDHDHNHELLLNVLLELHKIPLSYPRYKHSLMPFDFLSSHNPLIQLPALVNLSDSATINALDRACATLANAGLVYCSSIDHGGGERDNYYTLAPYLKKMIKAGEKGSLEFVKNVLRDAIDVKLYHKKSITSIDPPSSESTKHMNVSDSKKSSTPQKKKQSKADLSPKKKETPKLKQDKITTTTSTTTTTSNATLDVSDIKKDTSQQQQASLSLASPRKKTAATTSVTTIKAPTTTRKRKLPQGNGADVATVTKAPKKPKTAAKAGASVVVTTAASAGSGSASSSVGSWTSKNCIVM